MKVLLLFLCLLAVVLADPQSGESAEQSLRRHSCGGLVQEPPRTSTTASPPSTTQASQSTSGSSAGTSEASTVPSDGTSDVTSEPSDATSAPSEATSVPSEATSEASEATSVPSDATPSGPTSPPGDFHSQCILIQAFYNMSVTITIQQQVIFQEWIKKIENTILVNSALTDDEKVVQISIALKQFFELHVDIAIQLEYQQIADWGTCRDFLYVAISIQIEITQSVVTISGNDTCTLTEALQEASDNCGCPTNEQDAMVELIAEIKAILKDGSYSYEQQLAIVFELFESFFESHANLKAYLLEVELEGFGSVASLLEVCHTYKRITTLSVAISGSTVADCALLAGLDAASKNSSFTPSVQLQISQLLKKLELFFQSNVDLSVRLEYISAQCYQMFKLEPFIIQIIEQVTCGEWGGDIYDLIFCSGICTNHGCGNPNDGPGPQGTSPAPTSVSTSSSSSPSTSSSLSPSTPSGVNCGLCPGLITINSQNKTTLTDVLLQNYNTWTLAKKSGFNTCFNKIRQAIWNDVLFPTPELKLAGCNDAFNAYSTNNKAIQDEVFNIQITVEITIRQFVGCTD